MEVLFKLARNGSSGNLVMRSLWGSERRISHFGGPAENSVSEALLFRVAKVLVTRDEGR